MQESFREWKQVAYRELATLVLVPQIVDAVKSVIAAGK